MIRVEQPPQRAVEQSDAALASTERLTALVHAINAAHVDYAEATLRDRSEFIAKLSSPMGPDEIGEILGTYTNDACKKFAEQSTRMSELLSELANHVYRPFESLMHEMTQPSSKPARN